MRKVFLSFCLLPLLWLPLQLSGQTSRLSGRTTDAEAHPLAYATITAFQLPDSTAAGGALSDEEGRFTIDLKPGKYSLEVSILSFSKKTIGPLDLSSSGLDLGDIGLVASDVNLDAVEINAERNQMVLKLDKRVFNVGSDLSNTARNASEILDNVPSVTVDMDGNVALRGSQNVRILIDGKPSGLVSASGADALRQLPGNLIESVEVITNPSSRYDAEGEVGIINIILKKEKRTGVNGVFELTGGWPHNHRASYSLNLRKKKFNLFSSYALTYRESPGGGTAFQQFNQADTSFSYTSTRTHQRGGLGHALTFGSDFFLNSRNTLTVSGLYRGSVNNNEAILEYNDFNFENVNTKNTIRNDDEKETQNVIEGALSFVRTFPQKGRKWTIDTKFVDSGDEEISSISQFVDGGVPPLFQRSGNIEDERTWFSQTDYIHPIGKNARVEMGYRGNLRRIQNDFLVEEQQDSGAWTALPGFDNNFIYLENIQAAYLQAANKTGKLSYQAGLRAEYTDITTELLTDNEKNQRRYLNLFPSAFLGYEFSKVKTLQLSYSRRLSRPGFRQLLPFTSFSDNRNLRTGNPNLNPEYTHSVEAGYLQYLKKGSLLSSIYYRHRTGVTQRVVLPDENGNTIRIPVNLALQHAYGLEFNLSISPAKWWKINSNFNFYRQITSGSYQSCDTCFLQSFDADTYTWNTRINSKMTLWKNLDFQATLNYRGPERQPQGFRKGIYFVHVGLSKDILRGKGTLALNGQDIFNTRRWRWTIEEDNYYQEGNFQWRARQIQLTFTYRLNQDKQKSRNNSRESF